MELKFKDKSLISTKILGFNRTFMELKYDELIPLAT